MKAIPRQLLFSVLAALGTAVVAGCGLGPPGLEIITPTPVGYDEDKAKKKEACRGGCSLAKHDIAPFTDAQFLTALETYATEAPDAPSPALDKLLFYNKRTKGLIAELGTGALPEEHLAVLRRELTRDHAVVRVRMVDAAGNVRLELAPTRVPFGIKQHLHPEHRGDLQPLEISGTVMRVGLGHIWARY